MRTRLACLALLALVGSTGLFASVGFAGHAQKGGTLRLSGIGDIDSVDSALAYQAVSWAFEDATCAKLYNNPDKPAPEGANVVPEIATSFPKVSGGGKTQTIQLRRTFRFHTGARITAANFVAAFNRVANPKMQSPMPPSYLHEIVGADRVIAGKAQSISGVTAPGPYTLQIRTTRPLHDLAARLTMPFFCPIATNTPLVEIDNPLGSGPYYVASRIPNRQIVFERNRFYGGHRPARVDRIVFSVGLGEEACLQAVEANEQDWCAHLPVTSYHDLADRYGINRPGGRFFFTPTTEAEVFAFNHDRPAFKGSAQIPLKQAINWAIDRRALAGTYGYLGAKRSNQILPLIMGRDRSPYPTHAVDEGSLAKARSLLAKARFRPDKLVLYTCSCTYRPFGPLAQVFQFDLKRLGIEVEIKYFGFDELNTRIGTRGEPFDVAIWVWEPDWADGVAFFRPLLHGGFGKEANTNVAYFDRPKYNRDIDQIDRLTGEPRRKGWADLDLAMMRDDPPWAPFANFAQVDLVSKSVGCYVLQPVIGRIDLVAACKK